MALSLTFTAPSGAGFSRSRVKRRLNRYRRSSDALRRRRYAYSALHCARRRVFPPRLVSPIPAPAGSTPVAQVVVLLNGVPPGASGGFRIEYFAESKGALKYWVAPASPRDTDAGGGLAYAHVANHPYARPLARSGRCIHVLRTCP